MKKEYRVKKVKSFKKYLKRDNHSAIGSLLYISMKKADKPILELGFLSAKRLEMPL